MILMRGELVTLEPLDVEKHAAGYYEVSQDENIHKYVGNTVPKTVGEIVDLLKEYEKHFLNWMIISNETNAVIGIIRLGKPQMENGILVAGESQRLCSKYWRKGHMKEAKRLFYQYVFEELSVEKLYADVWEGNINSIKSLESSGYKLVETTNDIFSKTGKAMEKYIFSLSRADYQSKMTITYGGAAVEDIDSIYQLNKKLIYDYENIENIDLDKVLKWVKNKIESRISEYSVVYANGQKAGYYHFYKNEDGEAELDDLYIFPKFQNRGIGSTVINKCCLSVNAPVMLYVFIKNERAVALYKRLGFGVTETIRDSRFIMKKL